MRYKITILSILFTALFSRITLAQKKVPYVIYNNKGKKVSYEKMLKSVSTTEILLFGEYHDNPICHWLQLELTKDLYKEKKEQLVLGAEMIETDNQEALNRYLKNEIDFKTFDSLSRLWGNYQTDYAPLVNFAKTKNLNFIATNVPRRYARTVFRKGTEELEKLSEKEKAWIAPLPFPFDIELTSYQNMLKMMGGTHANPNFPKAQAIKDATMAHFILKNFKEGNFFIHYNGAYHSDIYEGVYWYLKKYQADINIKTISTVSQKNIHKLEKEHLGKADFIICVDDDMTKTH